MDMAADHAVHAAQLRLAGHDFLETGDILDRVLDLVLQPGRQRPVGQAHALAHRKQQVVAAQRHAIGAVAQMGEPLGAGNDTVKAVAMQHPEALAVGGFMDGFVHDLDAAEQPAGIVAGKFIVIAGHEDDAAARIHLAQHLRHHFVLGFGPVPAALHLPAVHDIADQEQRFAFIVGQEVGQRFGLAAARSQMRVGDEDGAMDREACRIRGDGGWRPGTSGIERAQRIVEVRNLGHRVSPALSVAGDRCFARIFCCADATE